MRRATAERLVKKALKTVAADQTLTRLIEGAEQMGTAIGELQGRFDYEKDPQKKKAIQKSLDHMLKLMGQIDYEIGKVSNYL